MSGYSIYVFPWTEIDEGIFGWDGNLLNNTPLRQVLQASPRNDKNIYISENYPKKLDRLPSNMVEALNRSRDIKSLVIKLNLRQKCSRLSQDKLD